MKTTRRIFIIIVPVTLGGLIYIIYRTDSLLMFHWFGEMGLENKILRIREFKGFQQVQLPSLIIYSLPDALWLFSFSYLMLWIWKFQITKESVFWIFISPIIGISLELGQINNIIPGTFDPLDLLLIFIAIVIPFFNKIIHSKPYKNEIFK